jgi:hypothetical protein
LSHGLPFHLEKTEAESKFYPSHITMPRMMRLITDSLHFDKSVLDLEHGVNEQGVKPK